MKDGNERKTSRVLCIVLGVVVVVGLLLTFCLVRNSEGLRAEVAALKAQLEESMTAWQTTSEEKEALQQELNGTNNAIREAQQVLSDATAKAETLGAQVAELEQQQAELTGEAALLEQLNAYVAAMEQLQDATAQAASLAETRLSDARAQLNRTRAQLLQAQELLVKRGNELDEVKASALSENEALGEALTEAQTQAASLEQLLAEARTAQREALQMLRMHYEQSIADAQAQLTASPDETTAAALKARVENLTKQIAELDARLAELE